MPKVPLRIAILECDTPLDGTRAKYGGYGGVFTALLKAAASGMVDPKFTTSDLVISVYDVVTAQSYPSLSDIDAILITGSRFNSFDDDPFILKLVEFTKRVLEQDRVRIIGVCFGHQIVGRALGAKVARSEGGWEISVTAIDLTKKGQEIFKQNSLVCSSSFLSGRAVITDNPKALFQMHRDVVYEYPPGVEELAYTEKCEVQGMYIPKLLITVQGHPEFNEDIVRELLVARHGSGIFNDEMFQDAIGRVDKDQDGIVVAQAFLRFVLE